MKIRRASISDNHHCNANSSGSKSPRWNNKKKERKGKPTTHFSIDNFVGSTNRTIGFRRRVGGGGDGHGGFENCSSGEALFVFVSICVGL